MYIEEKHGLEGLGRIGWVELSRSRRSYHYRGMTFLKCVGYKYNCTDTASGVNFWITGPKRSGQDRLYGRGVVEIDEDAREEYWLRVRRCPQRLADCSYRC
jgi:hypothetical protein